MFILVYPVMAFASSGDSAVFIGSLHTQNNLSFPYKLCIIETAGVLDGYSLTDINGPDETCTSIRGKLTTDSRYYSIHETKVIYTRSAGGLKNLCYIHALLKLASAGNIPVLKGKFNGFREDGKTTCASGTMQLYGAEKLLKKLVSIAPHRDTGLREKAPEESLTKQQPFELAANKTWRIQTHDSTLTLEIWDGNQIDGDVLDVTLNGRKIFDESRLTGTPQSVSIPLLAGQSNIIEITSVADGYESPNTAMIRLTGSRGSATAQCNLDRGKKATIIVDR